LEFNGSLGLPTLPYPKIWHFNNNGLGIGSNLGVCFFVNGGGTEAMVITNAGNTLVGTPNDNGSGGVLQVAGATYGTVTAIATAQTAGLTLANTTASTSGATQQYSPASVLIGHAWNTTATAADNYVQALNQLQVTSSASPTGTLIWAFSTSATSTPSYTTAMSLAQGGALTLAGKIAGYNGVSTAGWGVPAIQAAARVTAQSAANSSIATYTVGAADGSFEVSANMNVTAVTVLSTTLTCTYTDESNTARTMILPVQQLTGSFIAGGLITATGAWETPTMHIRCKASTVITIKTAAGTFTGVTYTAEGVIRQLQ